MKQFNSKAVLPEQPQIITSTARQKHGSGLVELLVAMIVMNVIATAIFALLMDIGQTSHKVSNKIDSINSARNAIERISRDVRCGRSLGDVFGNQTTLQAATSSTPAVMGVIGSDVFPSNRNPVYGNGQTPANGWPWSGGPYTLSADTMIVQLPIFDSKGFPTAIPVGSGSPATTTVQENVETHIYRVIADPDTTNHPNEYIMQLSRIAGQSTSEYTPSDINSQPQTIVSGIVGPFGGDGKISVFQYIDKTDPTTARSTVVDASKVANLTGVIIYMEIMKNDSSKLKPQSLALKSEVFLRNNSMATTVGEPASLVK